MKNFKIKAEPRIKRMSRARKKRERDEHTHEQMRRGARKKRTRYSESNKIDKVKDWNIAEKRNGKKDKMELY